MTTAANWAYGTKLLIGGSGGTPIAELTNISGPELDTDEIDVTTHDSVDGFEEVIPGLKRTGVISIEGNFLPGDAGQAALLADYLSGVKKTYAILFPAAMAAEWVFSAFVKMPPSTEAPIDDKVPFTAELRVTGKPTLNLTNSGGLTALTGIEQQLGAALVFVPAFANAKLAYSVTVNTASTWIKLTPTAASHTITVNGVAVASGVQSGEITLGAAGSLTTVTISAKETNKIAKIYTITVVRP